MDDIIQLQRSEISEEVLMAFVASSTETYDLSAEDIQRLDDAKVPPTVIVAMLDHGTQTRDARKEEPLAAAKEPTPAPKVVVNAPEPDKVNISLFYEALAPYGTWSRDGLNDWVWAPNDALLDVNWRPYANHGHWAWTDYGWYWASDSPYGWAAFHYGRWEYDSRHRWSWAPDNVWGPAWVDWRVSDDFYGWAPLPFGSRFETGVGFSLHGKHVGFDFHAGLGESYYNFVPSSNFLDLHLGISLVSEHRRPHIYKNTKIVNNTYIYNDNRIINNGISTTMVEQATKQKLTRLNVVDARIAAGQPIRGEHRRGDNIEVYRPKVANVAPIKPPLIVARQMAAAARQERASERKEERQTNKQDRTVVMEAARQRMAKEKEARKDERAEAATERKEAHRDAITERKAAFETSKETRQNANQERRDARTEATTDQKTERQSNREERQNANQERREARTEATTDQKTERQSNREEKQNANQERREARTEATTDQKTERQSNREEKQNAAEERRDARSEAATEQKAERENNREEKRSNRQQRDSDRGE